jgi:hypothetical protein
MSGGSGIALLVASLIALSAASALARPDATAPVSADDELAAYCLGANRQLAERFRKMQLWGCGKGPDMAWCREAKARAPEAMRHRERLVIGFAKALSDKGLLDVERPADDRRKLQQIVTDGSADAAKCFNEAGARDDVACERLQRCEAAERLTGQ